MWNGMLSPDMTKRKLPASAVSFDPTEAGDENIENIDPTSTRAEGVLDIQFNPGGPVYSFWSTYEFYEEFKASGFDTAFLAERTEVHGPGGWGWPFGRTTLTGWAEGHNLLE